MGLLNQDINTFDRATQEWANQAEFGYDCGEYKVVIPYSFKDKFGILQIEDVQIVDDPTSGLPYSWSPAKETKKLVLVGVITRLHPNEIFEDLYCDSDTKKSEVCPDIKVIYSDGRVFDFINMMIYESENIESISTPELRYKSDIILNCDYWECNF